MIHLSDGLLLHRIPRQHPQLVWELRTADQSLAGYLDALDGETVWISHIGIDPRYRGLGHATRLLKAVFEHSPEKTISLAAAYFPAWREPGLTHDQLHDWYTRHCFRPDPAPGDPHRMTRLPVRATA